MLHDAHAAHERRHRPRCCSCSRALGIAAGGVSGRRYVHYDKSELHRAQAAATQPGKRARMWGRTVRGTVSSVFNRRERRSPEGLRAAPKYDLKS